MLAVLKLHGAYIPLDAALPAERLAFIVKDAGADAVISHSRLSGSLEQLPARPRRRPRLLPIIPLLHGFGALTTFLLAVTAALLPVR